MTEKIQCVVLEPGTNFDIEYHKIDPADETWKSALSIIETALDAQFIDQGEWDGIELKVRLLTVTPEFFEELETA